MHSATELARRIRQRERSAREALEEHLDRIARHDATLHAVVSVDAARARAEADAADAALGRGEVRGPLHGVPMTLKDGNDVAGLRTTVGTRELDRIATEDGAVAARLRAAGAVVFGHTNVAPWLADYQTANPVFGRTANPWNPARTAGGSSGGAAAAVAAGMTPLEIASDLAGSARQPAHMCGVYGLKTTEHRVPLTGFFRIPEAPRTVRILSTLGPLARDLDDLSLALSVIAGPDGRDGDVPAVPLAAPPRRELAGVRLAIAPTVPGVRVQQALSRQVERIGAEASRFGARVVERLPAIDWDDLHALFRDLLAAVTGLLDPKADLRDEQRTLAWYLTALDRRDRFIAAWHDYFHDVDALVLPPATTTAFPHCDSGAAIDVDGERRSYVETGGLVAFCNLAGLPALVAPAGRDDDGLPIGVQLVGPAWSEPALIELARALERAGVLPGFQPPPGY